MPKKLFLKPIKYLSVFALMFFCGINFGFAKENSSVNVESKVSATANSGGSTISGSGTIKTGDATATAKSVTVVNGGENVESRTEARAETGGKNSTASVEVNGEKKSCTGENEAGCEVEIKTENSLVESAVESEEVVAEMIEVVEEEKKDSQSIRDFFSNMIAKIISWF